MPVKPPAQQHKTEDSENKLVISMPGRKKPGLIIILFFCSLTWLLMEILVIFVFTSILSRGSALLLLIVWGGLGALVIYPLAWQIFGKEEVQITDQLIRISYVVLGLKRSKEYPGSQINDLRVTPFDRNDPRNGSNLGSIYFSYDSRTTYKYATFAASVDEAEAKQIISEIQQKYPIYK